MHHMSKQKFESQARHYIIFIKLYYIISIADLRYRVKISDKVTDKNKIKNKSRNRVNDMVLYQRTFETIHLGITDQNPFSVVHYQLSPSWDTTDSSSHIMYDFYLRYDKAQNQARIQDEYALSQPTLAAEFNSNSNVHSTMYTEQLKVRLCDMASFVQDLISEYTEIQL